MAPSRYAFVVLSDVGALPGGFENELRNYVRGGGSVLVALGHESVARDRVPVSDGAIAGSRYCGARRRTLPDRGVARFLASLDPEATTAGTT